MKIIPLNKYIRSNFSSSLSNGSDWSHIELESNPPTIITLRSKQAVESLYFMLGQMLKGDL